MQSKSFRGGGRPGGGSRPGGGGGFRKGKPSFGRSGGSSGRFGGGSRPGGRSFGGKRKKGVYINPSKYINKIVKTKEEEIFIPKHQFKDFGFPKELQKTLDLLKYVTPTPIQDGAIPFIMEGKDVIGLANTGSGKTGAFLLPSIQNLLSKGKNGMILIVAPTRELAIQIERELFKFTYGLRIYGALCVGGMSIYTQKQALLRRPHFVIGTPGRLKDFIDRGTLRLDNVATFVLDEVDRMLDMGFINDITYIIDKLPKERQNLCFSATTSRDIDILLSKMLKDPVTVSVRTSETGEHIEQDIIKAHSREHKMEILVELLKKPEFSKVIIFGETKMGVERLTEFLENKNLRVDSIHGDKSQGQRRRALMNFKEDKVNILVATDVAARGLDIPNVSHVINFEEPQNYEDYIHRIGRTGRAGKKGMALTFVNMR